MAMGSTGTVNVSPEMLNNAIKAVENYRDTLTDLNSQLDGVMAELIPGNFSGSAADGFRAFYDEKIQPATADTAVKLLDTLVDISTGINKAIVSEEGADEKLAQENRGV